VQHPLIKLAKSVVGRWGENRYWQYFCGYTHMQHCLPIHPTSLTPWQQRIGEYKLDELLQYTIDPAVGNKHIQRNELVNVNVDTTVQEKNITFPTDSKLLYKAIFKLVDAAQARCTTLRQSYRAWGNAKRSWSAIMHIPDNSNTCVANCVVSKRMLDVWSVTSNAKPHSLMMC
jgi:hypothetical protein